MSISIRRNWCKILTHWKDTVAGRRSATLPKCDFPRLLKQLQAALQPNAAINLVSGFRTCGIVTCDIEPLLKRLPRLQTLNLNAVGESFRKFVESKCQELVETSIRKRKRTNAVAGEFLLNFVPYLFLAISLLIQVECVSQARMFGLAKKILQMKKNSRMMMTLSETERCEAENSDGEESNDESNSEDESATGSENEMAADANAVVPAAEVPASPEVYFRIPNTALFFLLPNPLITFGIPVGTGQRE